MPSLNNVFCFCFMLNYKLFIQSHKNQFVSFKFAWIRIGNQAVHCLANRDLVILVCGSILPRNFPGSVAWAIRRGLPL
jgi:hypothetical protein